MCPFSRHEYVTMHITFLTRKSALIYRRGLRQRVASLTLDCNGSRRSRIFLRRGPLSYEVPGRRDSVGGGVVAEIFSDLRKPSRFSGGGGSSRNFL